MKKHCTTPSLPTTQNWQVLQYLMMLYYTNIENINAGIFPAVPPNNIVHLGLLSTVGVNSVHRHQFCYNIITRNLREKMCNEISLKVGKNIKLIILMNNRLVLLDFFAKFSFNFEVEVCLDFLLEIARNYVVSTLLQTTRTHKYLVATGSANCSLVVTIVRFGRTGANRWKVVINDIRGGSGGIGGG